MKTVDISLKLNNQINYFDQSFNENSKVTFEGTLTCNINDNVDINELSTKANELLEEYIINIVSESNSLDDIRMAFRPSEYAELVDSSFAKGDVDAHHLDYEIERENLEQTIIVSPKNNILSKGYVKYALGGFLLIIIVVGVLLVLKNDKDK